MKYIDITAWKPAGIESLEFATEQAICCSDNVLVTAGPGAGKTELLAQKACFLLETNIAQFPKKVLAISFKKDAATNLKKRVKLRCPTKLSNRFESFTYDSFFKNLLDRFRLALPKPFLHSENYDIINLTNRNYVIEILEKALVPTFEVSVIYTISTNNFENDFLCSEPLLNLIEPDTDEQKMKQALWNYLLFNQNEAKLSFRMISRLAELIFSTNPVLLDFLQKTYSFVFLDEFQDTTNIQYGLVKLLFNTEKCKITAVGDDKQRIMGWAGAMNNVFDAFVNDFSAEPIELLYNYRSVQKLVDIQNLISKELSPQKNYNVQSQVVSQISSDHCSILHFSNHQREAEYLADFIDDKIKNGETKCQEICILARGQCEDYTKLLQEALKKKGVKSRIENDFQDLLSEPLVTLIISILKMACVTRSREDYSNVIYYLNKFSDDKEKMEEFELLIKKLKLMYSKDEISKNNIQQVLNEILIFLNKEHLLCAYPQYCQTSYLNTILERMYMNLYNGIEQTNSLRDSISSLEGIDTIPIMTIHKSKGLEYKIVIFIGLEDQSLWGYRGNSQEETCAFFVAFSRAKEQVIFTFSNTRDNFPRNMMRYTNEIANLYEVLAGAGIIPKKIE